MGVSKVNPTADVPTMKPTETDAPARPKPCTLAHATVVALDHVVVMQVVTPIATEGVASAKIKFSPESVKVLPPLVAMFRKLLQEITGESNVNDVKRVPTTSKTVIAMAGTVCGYPA